MSEFKPGEFRITQKAMEKWQLPEGSKVLDLGSGRGDTLNYLKENFGFNGTGLEMSLKMIEEGKNRYPDLELKYGDMEFLEEFSSHTFDGVLSECAMSVVGMPEEAIHEAYCVLKKGGKLFISDLYIKNPTVEFIMEQAKRAKESIDNMKHSHDDTCGDSCEDEHRNRIFEYRADGRFIIRPLIRVLEEIGFEDIYWEDCTDELDRYVAEKIMKDGSLDGCRCEGALKPSDSFRTGYFMLTATKPQ